MEDTTRENTTGSDRESAADVALRRQEARDFLAAQQRRLNELETALVRKVGHISQELVQARQAALDTEADLLENRSQLEAATKKLRLDERGLAQLRRENEANAEELAYHRQRLQQKLAELELDRANLDAQVSETNRQRREIAHRLKAQREENRRWLERESAELEQRRDARSGPDAIERQVTELEQRLFESEAKLKAAQNEAGVMQRQVADLEQQLLEATEQLKVAEQRPTAEPTEDLTEALADMKRRYELAMDDLREQKRRVAELEKQPAAAARAAPAADQGGKLDWEAQKQRMLAALEADADGDDDEDRQQERLKMRDVVSRTEAAIAEKDRELDELRQLLAAQSANVGAVAVGAAAFAEALSADEVVRHERERLQQLQHEWEEKLREAEIELSVQRARIARERAEIEERQRLLQDQQADGGGAAGHDTNKALKPQRGRWLARLGLKEDE